MPSSTVLSTPPARAASITWVPISRLSRYSGAGFGLVEADAADSCGEVDHLGRTVVGDHVGGRRRVGQVVVGAADDDRIGARRRQLGDHSPAEEPGATGHDDAPAGPESGRRWHRRQCTSRPVPIGKIVPPVVWKIFHGDRMFPAVGTDHSGTCCGAGRDRSAESEEYLVRQLVGLAAVAPELPARLLVAPGFASAHPELAERFEIVTGSGMTRDRGGRLFAEAFTDSAQFADVDVVHHAGGTLPLRHRRRPTLLTVHDVQYLAASALLLGRSSHVPSQPRATISPPGDGDRRAQPLRGTHVGRCF